MLSAVESLYMIRQYNLVWCIVMTEHQEKYEHINTLTSFFSFLNQQILTGKPNLVRSTKTAWFALYSAPKQSWIDSLVFLWWSFLSPLLVIIPKAWVELSKVELSKVEPTIVMTTQTQKHSCIFSVLELIILIPWYWRVSWRQSVHQYFDKMFIFEYR